MNNEAPTGQRFSQVYLERGKALRDSPRFRKRLERVFLWAEERSQIDFGRVIQAETGCEVPSGSYGYLWQLFFASGEMRDILDAITIIYGGLLLNQFNDLASPWRDEVRRIMREENIGYRLDDAAGVHFLVDEEFERGRVASLAGLGEARYSSARQDFELAHAALDSDPADTRGAVRHVFDALETVFRLALGKSVSRLGASEIDKKLWPLVLPLYDGAARDNAGRMMASFKEWANGAHQYRHAQGVEQPAPPPIDLAVMIVSAGGGWLRWLIEIDGKLGRDRS